MPAAEEFNGVGIDTSTEERHGASRPQGTGGNGAGINSGGAVALPGSKLELSGDVGSAQEKMLVAMVIGSQANGAVERAMRIAEEIAMRE